MELTNLTLNCTIKSASKSRVSNTPGNPGNILELSFLPEMLEIFWKFAKSPGNFLAEFVCLLLL